MIPPTAQPVKLEQDHRWQPVENIPKVLQNTAFVYPSMRLSVKREGISQVIAFCGVFVLAASDNNPHARLIRSVDGFDY